MRKIDADHPYIKQIAEIHESIPAEYKNYKAAPLDIALRYESIRLLMHYQHDEIIILEKEDNLIGFIWFNAGEKMHIKSLWITPSERRKGLATKLKNHIADICRERDIQEIYSHVDMNNKKMRKLNEKLGYQSIKNEMRFEIT